MLKKLFHKNVQWRRVWLHVPHGVIIGLLALCPITWKIAEIAWEVFREYEWSEDLHTHDQAWNDLLGLLFGIAIVALLALLASAVLIIWLTGRLL